MQIYKEEIFGPVLSMVRAHDYSERAGASRPTMITATALRSSPATATPRALRAPSVNVGMVGINVPIPVPIAYYTSAAGRSPASATSTSMVRILIRFYTKTKTVTSRWPSGIKEGAEFSIPDDELTHDRLLRLLYLG